MMKIHSMSHFHYIALPDCRYTPRPDGILTISMDQVEFAQSQGECESLCDQVSIIFLLPFHFRINIQLLFIVFRQECLPAELIHLRWKRTAAT